ncbi:MAG: DUF4912 domain-containing protein [Planctomycetota bacterium]
MKDPKKKSGNKGHLFQKSDGPTVRDLREQARLLGLPFKDYWHLKKQDLIDLIESLTAKTKKEPSKSRSGKAETPPAVSKPAIPASDTVTASKPAAPSGRSSVKPTTGKGGRASLGRINPKAADLPVEMASSRIPLTPPPTGFREPLEPHDVYIDRGMPLPQTYSLDRVTILPRDPHYLFIFWELDGPGTQEARRRGGEWVLRIDAVTRGSSFDIYVGGAVCWYLKVSEGEQYRAHIGVKQGDGQFFEVACSDVRAMPVSDLSHDPSETWAVVVRDARKLHRTRAVAYVIAHRDRPDTGWEYPLEDQQKMLRDAEFDEIQLPGGEGTTITRRRWRVPLGRFAYESAPVPLGSSAMTRYRGEWQAEAKGEEIEVMHVLKQAKPKLDVPSSFSGTLQPRPTT